MPVQSQDQTKCFDNGLSSFSTTHRRPKVRQDSNLPVPDSVSRTYSGRNFPEFSAGLISGSLKCHNVDVTLRLSPFTTGPESLFGCGRTLSTIVVSRTPPTQSRISSYLRCFLLRLISISNSSPGPPRYWQIDSRYWFLCYRFTDTPGVRRDTYTYGVWTEDLPTDFTSKIRKRRERDFVSQTQSPVSDSGFSGPNLRTTF